MTDFEGTEQALAEAKDAPSPKRMGLPVEYAKLVLAIVDDPMRDGQCLRLDAGRRFAPDDSEEVTLFSGTDPPVARSGRNRGPGR
ncbi:hypothetical protein [Amycolatopsis acidicola]|uniref:hypothetical protein n=1 Tax=Amycolatopsis acidicola TaxID=2596893 RepID=UPI001FB717BC|nr:hypothetical protein [Amycolatopsis acidicola]